MVLTPNNMVWLADILKPMPVGRKIVIFHVCSCIQNGIITAQLDDKDEYIKTRREIIEMASTPKSEGYITYEHIETVLDIFKKAGYLVDGKYGPKGNAIRISWSNVVAIKKDTHTYQYYNCPITNLKTFYRGRVRSALTEKVKPELIDMDLVNIITITSEPYISKNVHQDTIYKFLERITDDSAEGAKLSKFVRDDIIDILSDGIEDIAPGNIFVNISHEETHLSSPRFPYSHEIVIKLDIKIVPNDMAMSMITKELNSRIEKDRSLIERCAHALGLIK